MATPLPTYQQAASTFSLSRKIGQLLMPAAFVNDSEAEIQKLETQIRELDIGGICFFHSRASAATNFEGEKEVPLNPDSLGRLKELIVRYQRAARFPLLIAIDAEWGLAMRLENGEAYPYALCLGALSPGDELIRRTGYRMGIDCREAGIHWNLAPVADVNLNPDNPVIGYRSFGANPGDVAEHSVAFFKGMNAAGILGCAKHFPGHGDTATDSHLELPVLETSASALEATELLPFQALINAGIDGVMPGHLTVPALDPGGLPATLSPTMIQEVLRGKLGFNGVVISDALNMHAVSKRYSAPGELAAVALQAGNDILCFVENLEDSVATITKSAELAKDKSDPTLLRVEASFERVWKLKERVFNKHGSARHGDSGDSKIPIETPGDLREALAEATLTLVKTNKDKPDIASSTWIFAGEDLIAFESELGGAIKEGIRIPWDKHGELTSSFTWQLPAEEDVILVLAPPKLKPGGNFGLPLAFTDYLSALCAQRSVSVCLLGNPYVLNLSGFTQAREILLTYAPLEEFQKQAARYYLGKAHTPGKLPVKIPGF